jgi:hypothetical protein
MVPCVKVGTRAPIVQSEQQAWQPAQGVQRVRSSHLQGGCYCKSGVEAPRYTLRSERVDWTSLAGMVSRCSCWKAA